MTLLFEPFQIFCQIFSPFQPCVPKLSICCTSKIVKQHEQRREIEIFDKGVFGMQTEGWNQNRWKKMHDKIDKLLNYLCQIKILKSSAILWCTYLTIPSHYLEWIDHLYISDSTRKDRSCYQKGLVGLSHLSRIQIQVYTIIVVNDFIRADFLPSQFAGLVQAYRTPFQK